MKKIIFQDVFVTENGSVDVTVYDDGSVYVERVAPPNGCYPDATYVKVAPNGEVYRGEWHGGANSGGWDEFALATDYTSQTRMCPWCREE